jgi:tRNA nucleotidyltransferase (CCA-adding enzyme)
MKLPDELAVLLRQVPALARAYLVGGCVRDSLLGIAHKDFDLEVYGVGYEALEKGLRAHGRVDLVGKSFGVIKFSAASV